MICIPLKSDKDNYMYALCPFWTGLCEDWTCSCILWEKFIFVMRLK